MAFGGIMLSFSPLMPCFYRVQNGQPCFGRDNSIHSQYIVSTNYIMASLLGLIVVYCWFFWLNHFTNLYLLCKEIVIDDTGKNDNDGVKMKDPNNNPKNATPSDNVITNSSDKTDKDKGKIKLEPGCKLTPAKVDKWAKDLSDYLDLLRNNFSNLLGLFVLLLIMAAISSVLTALSSLTAFQDNSPGPWLQFVVFTSGIDLGCVCMLWAVSNIEEQLSSESGRIGGIINNLPGSEKGNYIELSYMHVKMDYWNGRYKGVSILGIDLTKNQLRIYIGMLLSQPIAALIQAAWNWGLSVFGT